MINLNKKVFSFLFLLWIVISFLTIPYHLVSLFSEIKDWWGLSEDQKRQKLFGATYDFVVFIEGHTDKESKIFVFSNDVRIGMVSNYFLYPRNVFSTTDRKKILELEDSKEFDYIALYNKKINFKNYEFVEKYASKKDANYGGIYRLK